MTTREIFVAGLSANMVHYFSGALSIEELLADAGVLLPVDEDIYDRVKLELRDASAIFSDYLRYDEENDAIFERLYSDTAKKIARIVYDTQG
jgi:hypothetical protein